MQFQAALIDQQGSKFAVVAVQKHIMDNSFWSARVKKAFDSVFTGTPIVLSSHNSNGAATYAGPRNLAKLLASMPQEGLAWKEYDLEW